MSQNNIETNAENYEIEDGPFRKKIKLEYDNINEKHISIQMNMKYQELIVLCSSDEEFSDSEDGITEILLPIGKQISIILLMKILTLWNFHQL